jgi:hypothetical protein
MKPWVSACSSIRPSSRCRPVRFSASAMQLAAHGPLLCVVTAPLGSPFCRRWLVGYVVLM